MKFSKYLGIALICFLIGWAGYRLGQLETRIRFNNWKPTVVVNQAPPTGLVSAKDVDFSLFWTVWDKLNESYVDKSKLDAKKMVDGAISGMVASLGDPYTAYLPIEQNKSSKEELGGAFEGVGIQLGYSEERLVVMSPLEGSPAAKAGVRPGDYIIRIQDSAANVDRETEGISIPEAVKLIRGKKGTSVKLTLARVQQDKPMVVDLVRDTIIVRSVTTQMEELNGKSFAWVKLGRFGDRTNEEWAEAVNKYLNECSNCRGMVLDLRNNPGGYLEGAVHVAGEFVGESKVVVTQQYGDGRRFENKVSRNGQLLKTPVVVLVNKGSASAAEILAGALQDYGRAKVVGVQSFGKGSVQQPDDFADGSGVHITVAKWLRPNEDWIDHKGITPDVVVEWAEPKEVPASEDPQLVKAVDLL